MANLKGDTRSELLASAKQDVLSAEQQVLSAEADLAAARRDDGTDAALEEAVADAQEAVNADTSEGGARELQMKLQDAEADVADHVAANGDDEAVAKALFDAIAAYVEEGGTAADFSAFTSAYNAEVLKADANQDFSTVVNDAASVFTVTDGSVTAPDLGTEATAELRVAVREAALVADKRDELNDAVTSAETAFTADDTVIDTPATAAELTVDLSSAELSSGGTVDGSALTQISYTDQADLLTKLGNEAGIASATVDTNTLTITSASTGSTASLEIIGFATTDDTDADPGAVAEETGSDAVTSTATSLGQKLVNAQDAVEQRENEIDAVAEAEATVVEEQAELDALTELVDTYVAAGEDVQAARDSLEEDFGIESLVEVADGDNVGTTDTGELFLFSQTEDAQSLSIAFEAEDQLYIGEGFTLNSEADFSEGEGDASAMEVFFVQQGANTQVQIEQTEFGSNAATPEVDTITLTGVNAEDLSFSDGYINVA